MTLGGEVYGYQVIKKINRNEPEPVRILLWNTGKEHSGMGTGT